MITPRPTTWPRSRTLSNVWLMSMLLGFVPALVAQPHMVPAVFQDEWTRSVSQVHGLAARSEAIEATESPLVGLWVHPGRHGPVTLKVISADVILVSGREMRYSLWPGVITVKDDAGEFNYPYRLVNDRLILTISDGKSVHRDVSFYRMNSTPREIGYSPEDHFFR